MTSYSGIDDRIKKIHQEIGADQERCVYQCYPHDEWVVTVRHRSDKEPSHPWDGKDIFDDKRSGHQGCK